MPVWWGDFYDLAGYGANSSWRPDAFTELDWLTDQCDKLGIYVIIDMHGVVGGQSTSDDTGQENQNAYWTNSTYQGDTAWMWRQIAKHYRANTTVAGYDLINEPIGAPSTAAVWSAYDSLYTTIRSVDKKHIIVMEGAFGNWDWDMLPDPSTYGWTNIVYEMHEYQFGAHTATVEAGAANQVGDFDNHKQWNVPAYVGEFNDMGNGAACWKYTAALYDNAAINWSMWSYKAIDGLEPDSWGYYDPTFWPTKPNISTDPAATIASDWQEWTTPATFVRNSSVPCPTGPISDGTYTLTPACAPLLRLNALGASEANGTNVDVEKMSGAAGQEWILTQTSGNIYRLKPSYDHGLCLDVSSAGTADGTNVDIWASNYTDAQQWFITSLGDGKYSLSPECAPGSCLDVVGAGSTSGTNIDIYTANSTNAQIWTIGHK